MWSKRPSTAHILFPKSPYWMPVEQKTIKKEISGLEQEAAEEQRKQVRLIF